MPISLNEVIALAAHYHESQTDKIGQPYIAHPMRVSAILKKLFPDAPDYVLMAAWLHDVLEDCDVSYEELLALDIDPRALEIVQLLTKPENDMRPYASVIADIITSNNEWAMRVKLCDNLDNANPDRNAALSKVDMDKAQSLMKKYTQSLRGLSDALNLSYELIWLKIYGKRDRALEL